MKSIFNFALFICSMIKIFSKEIRLLADEDKSKTAMFEIKLNESKIMLYDKKFEFDMKNPLIIGEKGICLTESAFNKKPETITLNGINYSIDSCSLNYSLKNLSGSTFNLSNLRVYDPGDHNVISNKFGLGEYKQSYEKNSYLSIFLNETSQITGNKIFFKSSTNSYQKNDTYFMALGEKIPGVNSEFKLPKNVKNDSWVIQLNGFHFGTNESDMTDNIKYPEKVINISGKNIILNEGLLFNSPSKFPIQYLEEIIKKLNQYYQGGCKNETKDTKIYLKCENKNVSLYLINEGVGYHIPFNAIKDYNNNGYLNIVFEEREDFEFGLNILSALHRQYDIETHNFSIAPGEGLETVDLNEPTIKTTIITIIVITIIVVIITIIVMQLMKKDSNEAVDYNNMQQI